MLFYVCEFTCMFANSMLFAKLLTNNFFLFTFFFIYFNIHHNTAHNALFTRYACEYMYALKINTEKKNKQKL